MTRRDVIRKTAILTGVALTAPALLSLQGCSEPIADSYAPQIFNPENMDILRSIMDTLLPKSDFPSASQVKIDKRLDQNISKAYNKSDQEAYLQKFEALVKHLSFKQNILEQSIQDRSNLLSQLDRECVNSEQDHHKAYLSLKQQVISYYLSSEEVMTKHLNYLPIPGEYQACISLEEQGGKAWAI